MNKDAAILATVALLFVAIGAVAVLAVGYWIDHHGRIAQDLGLALLFACVVGLVWLVLYKEFDQ